MFSPLDWRIFANLQLVPDPVFRYSYSFKQLDGKLPAVLGGWKPAERPFFWLPIKLA
jgi:hypothetical protein